MASGRIKTSRLREEPTPRHIFTDHDWVRNNENSLLEQYGECYIIVHHEKVLGTGTTYQQAIENAERNLPEEGDEIEVMVDRIGRRHRMARVPQRKSM